MKFVLDENFGLEWVPALREAGLESVPWIDVGPQSATDQQIMDWARTHDHVVITKDLDFGYLLHVTSAASPSVVLVRAIDPRPEAIARELIWAIQHGATALELGALLVFDHHKYRVRILPLT
jgi:predicted nuclease of predicted toxin-antitoxin system